MYALQCLKLVVLLGLWSSSSEIVEHDLETCAGSNDARCVGRDAGSALLQRLSQKTLLQTRSTDTALMCTDINWGPAAPSFKDQSFFPVVIYPANGCVAQLWECNSGDNQKWEFKDGSLFNPPSGKCLDIAGEKYPADGTPVQIWECNKGPNQKWEMQEDGSVTNPNTGKCLDANIGGSVSFSAESPVYPNDGTRLQLWTCNGRANQKWNLIDGELTVSVAMPAPTTPKGPGCHCSYDLVSAPKSWADAQADCVSKGSKLTVPKNKDANKEVMQACQENSCWIGANIPHDLDGVNISIEWVDGNSNDFELWDKGEPNGVGEPGDGCIQIYGAGGVNVWQGRWNDVHCSHTCAYVCEKTDESCC